MRRLLRLRYVNGREEELRSFEEPPEVLTHRDHTFDRVGVQDGLVLYEETGATLRSIPLKAPAGDVWRPLAIPHGIVELQRQIIQHDADPRILLPGGDDY